MNLLKVTAAQAGRWSSIAAAFFLGFLLAALCFVAVTFGQTAGIHTSWLYYGSFIVVGAGISALMCLRYRLRIAVCTGIGFLVSILVLFHCDATPAKAFRRLDAAIQHGMTVADVRSAVQREFPERGRSPVPVLFESVPGSQIGDAVVIDSEEVHIMDRSFECHIVVSLRNGRVIDKQSNVTPSSDMARLWRLLPLVPASCAGRAHVVFLRGLDTALTQLPSLNAFSVCEAIILERIARGTTQRASVGICWHRLGWLFNGFSTFMAGQPKIRRAQRMNERPLTKAVQRTDTLPNRIRRYSPDDSGKIPATIS